MKIKLVMLVGLLAASGCRAASNGPFVDKTYGTGGVANFAYDLGGAGNEDVPQCAALLDDGSLMVAGYAYDAASVPSSPMVAMRFLSNGTIDSTFGTGNVVQLPSFAGGGISDLGLISDGNVALIGEYTNDDGQTFQLTIGRISADGIPDTSFNFNGFRGISPGTFGSKVKQAIGQRVIPLSDGKLLGMGFATDIVTTACAAVVRMNTDGSFDTTFAGTGYACYTTNETTTPSFTPFDMAVQPDGKIVVVGTGNHGSVADNADMAVLRLLADGTVDATFGVNGWAFVAFDLGGDLGDLAEAVSIDASGRIVIVGTASTTSSEDVVAARLLATGQIDTSFALMGRLDVPTSFSFKPSVAVLQDGRVLVVSTSATGFGFGAFMFKNNGSVDPSFGANGVYAESGSGFLVTNVSRLVRRADYIYLPGSASASADTVGSQFGVARLILPIFANGFDAE